MTDTTQYWIKRTRRIIKDLDEAFEACSELDVIEDVIEGFDEILERLGKTSSTDRV